MSENKLFIPNMDSIRSSYVYKQVQSEALKTFSPDVCRIKTRDGEMKLIEYVRWMLDDYIELYFAFDAYYKIGLETYLVDSWNDEKHDEYILDCFDFSYNSVNSHVGKIQVPFSVFENNDN